MPTEGADVPKTAEHLLYAQASHVGHLRTIAVTISLLVNGHARS